MDNVNVPNAISFLVGGYKTPGFLSLRGVYGKARKAAAWGAMCASLCRYTGATDFTAQFTDIKLQKELIAYTTTYYSGTLTPSIAFPGNFYFKVTGKKGSLPPGPIPIHTLDLGDITKRLEAISSTTYVYGWADGAEGERARDLTTIENYATNCSSSPYFNVPSTAPWDAGVCGASLGNAYNAIAIQNLSAPPVIP